MLRAINILPDYVNELSIQDLSSSRQQSDSRSCTPKRNVVRSDATSAEDSRCNLCRPYREETTCKIARRFTCGQVRIGLCAAALRSSRFENQAVRIGTNMDVTITAAAT